VESYSAVDERPHDPIYSELSGGEGVFDSCVFD
jgi:hypothetical protein